MRTTIDIVRTTTAAIETGSAHRRSGLRRGPAPTARREAARIAASSASGGLSAPSCR
jgi:hypothetical protein